MSSSLISVEEIKKKSEELILESIIETSMLDEINSIIIKAIIEKSNYFIFTKCSLETDKFNAIIELLRLKGYTIVSTSCFPCENDDGFSMASQIDVMFPFY